MFIATNKTLYLHTYSAISIIRANGAVGGRGARLTDKHG